VPQRVPRLLLAVAFCVMFAALAIHAQRPRRTQPPIRPIDGASIFRQYCAACHGVEGHGDGPAASALKQKVPDLTLLSRSNDGVFPELHVRATILLGNDDLIPAHGSQQMPIWGPIFHEIDFDRDWGRVRLDNITSYLESIQKR